MFFRQSDLPIKVEFRPLFKTLLESLRLDIVDLHNGMGGLIKKHPQIYNSESITDLLQSLKLLEGDNNFLNQIEKMKRDVTRADKINIVVMIKNFNELKTDLLSVLNGKIKIETKDNTTITPLSEILQKSVAAVDKNQISLNGTKVNFEASRGSVTPPTGNLRSKL